MGSLPARFARSFSFKSHCSPLSNRLRSGRALKLGTTASLAFHRSVLSGRNSFQNVVISHTALTESSESALNGGGTLRHILNRVSGAPIHYFLSASSRQISPVGNTLLELIRTGNMSHSHILYVRVGRSHRFFSFGYVRFALGFGGANRDRVLVNLADQRTGASKSLFKSIPDPRSISAVRWVCVNSSVSSDSDVG